MSAINYGARTDVGTVAKENEDSLYTDSELGLWVVADGMGGHEAGEVASAIVVKTLCEKISDGDDLPASVEKAHLAIKEAAKQGVGAEGMGSTVVALRVQDYDFEVAWVGDSRAYLWDGSLSQISHDHSFVQRLVDSGALTEEDARVHPYRNVITQSLGVCEDELEVGYVTGTFSRGQKVLLCSDGLSDELSDAEIASILESGENDQTTVDKLIDRALAYGARDNITVQIVSAPIQAPNKGSRLRPGESLRDVGVIKELLADYWLGFVLVVIFLIAFFDVYF